ncbi:MAG: hypothetical protein ACQKBU_05255 [Verrucomicrobiales bacterium]
MRLRPTILATGLILTAGIIRAPLEQSLTEDLREEKLLSQPLEIETRKKVGQGFWAVSLGGLRTLVATVLSLRAQGSFEALQWEALADTYDTIVQLAPHSSFYWDTGHWHMAYNAASHHQRNLELPEIRRQAEWRKWIQRGNAFLEEGLQQNPEDTALWRQLGWAYSNPLKLVDYDKAAAAYRQAIATGGQNPHVLRAEAYAMARSENQIDAALHHVRALYQNPQARVPTLRCLLFALEMRANPDREPHPLAMEIFQSPSRAYRLLRHYFSDPLSTFPMHGVARELRHLENDLGIPKEDSVFTTQE